MSNFQAPISAAHFAHITIGGARYTLHRSLSHIRTIEEAFGPLQTLARRLGRFELVATEIVTLYELALAPMGNAVAPARADIEAHILDKGVLEATYDIHGFVLCLLHGNSKIEAMIAREDAVARAAGKHQPNGATI